MTRGQGNPLQQPISWTLGCTAHPSLKTLQLRRSFAGRFRHIITLSVLVNVLHFPVAALGWALNPAAPALAPGLPADQPAMRHFGRGLQTAFVQPAFVRSGFSGRSVPSVNGFTRRKGSFFGGAGGVKGLKAAATKKETAAGKKDKPSGGLALPTTAGYKLVIVESPVCTDNSPHIASSPSI